MKIVIIGGGPAGVTCAINCKNDNNEVIILEKNNDILKKLLVTGSGHCNLFNEVINIDCYNSYNKDILKDIITEDNINKVLPYLNDLGILTRNKNGYLYPMAYTAYAPKNALKMALERNNIKVYTNEEVLSIKKDNNKFIINTNNNTFDCDKLVIATGSKAYPNLGSSDSALRFAKSFGIQYKEFLPSLTGLKIDNKVTKKWDKLRCDVKLSYFEDDKFIKSEEGEIQLTSYGISGICVFNLSSNIIKNINNHKEEIKIDFLPMINNFIDFINERIKRFKGNNPIELLEGLINYKILYAILDDTDLINKKNEELNNKDIELLDNIIKNYTVTITGYNSFDNAQVCSGGVLLSEINPKTFECNTINNLFFIGEALDVDGICGGYNLGFAWLSGIICGTYINNC